MRLQSTSSPVADIIHRSDFGIYRTFSDGSHMQLLKLNMLGNHSRGANLRSVAGVTMLAVSALLVTACDSSDPKAAAT